MKMAASTQAMAEEGLRFAETKTATVRTARTSRMITTTASQSIANIRVSSLVQTSSRSVYAAVPLRRSHKPSAGKIVQPAHPQGAGKALELGVGPAQAIILGAVTGVGGGTVRDVLIQRVPSVLSSGLYAIPALVGAALVVAAESGGISTLLGVPVALGAAVVCFLIRMVGLHFEIDAPKPPGIEHEGSGASGNDGG